MGRVARQSHAFGHSGQRTGEETGSQGKAGSSRHFRCTCRQLRNWKHHGRPTCLPAGVPLDLPRG